MMYHDMLHAVLLHDLLYMISLAGISAELSVMISETILAVSLILCRIGSERYNRNDPILISVIWLH